jgi:tRNA(Arg) A34 adenosine deaminase TadA
MNHAVTDAERAVMDAAIDRALALAARDDGRAGIVAAVMRGDTLLAFGENEVHRRNDPTRHAEIVAISRATRALATPDLTGATLLTTLQPCEMCLGAMRFAGMARLIYAATKPKVAGKYFMFPALGIEQFQNAADGSFTQIGGVGEARVLALYADAQE